MMPGPQIKPEEISFTRVADYFLKELKQGKNPSVQEFSRAFPHLASDIETQFPALAMLERALGHQQELPAETPSKELGGCRIEEEIGRGAMGTVYRANQLDLDRTVAIKVIPLHGVNHPSLVERFELERRAMARLDHPNIVPVYSYGHDSKHAFLVMKLINGQSLDMLLSEGGDYQAKVRLLKLQSNWSEFAMVGAAIADGLQHAHDQGLIHRDIKPGNLILDSHGKIWITDFGLAKVYDYARSLSRTGDAVGTPRYMAPEQLRGICDPRSDVYSLGITLYELATGCAAWDDVTFSQITTDRASLHLEDLREINRHVPVELAKIIMKACSFDPAERYQSAAEMRIVLKRFTSGVLPSDRRRKRRLPDDVFRKRSRRNMIIVTGCSIALFSVGTYLYSQYQNYLHEQRLIEIAAVERAKKDTSINFLEKLAEPNVHNMKNVVGDFVRESIDNSGARFGLSSNEKEQITQQVDQIFTQIRGSTDRRISEEEFLAQYRASTIPLATNIMSYVRVIDRSGLSVKEKNDAYETLRYFAKATLNRRIPENEAVMHLATLTDGHVYTAEQLNQVTLPDSRIRGWLHAIRFQIAKLPPSIYQEPLMLQEQLGSALNNANVNHSNSISPGTITTPR